MDTHTIEFRGIKREVVRNQLVVKLAADSTPAESGTAVFERVLGPGRFAIIRDADDRGMCLIEFAEGERLEAVVELLESDSSVIFAEPNDVAEQCAIPLPNDPFLSQQWALTRIGANAAWQYNTASPSRVLVAVADSGIPMRNGQLSHEELSDARWFLIGSDFTGSGNVAADDNGHGTHVIGIASARARNKLGIAGLAYTSTTLSLKVFTAAGSGAVFWVYQAAQEALTISRQRQSRLIFNYSGRGLTPSRTWNETAQVLRDGDALLIAATGNDAGPVGYPAALSPQFDNVIAVGATDQNDVIADFSNRGPEINVVAPGVGILSTFPDYPVAGGFPLNYGAIDGTSMATPLVTGLAAIVWTQYYFYDAPRVRRRLEETAVDLGSLGQDPVYGFGRIDARAALETAPLYPGEPVPRPQFWPNAPHPPPAKSVLLDAIHPLGAIIATARWLISVGKPLDAKRELQGARNAASRNGVIQDLTVLDLAIASPTEATAKAAHDNLRQQTAAAKLYKAPWLDVRAIYDAGYRMNDADWFAQRRTDLNALLARLDSARDAVGQALIYGTALLEYDPFRERVATAADLIAAVPLIRAYDSTLKQAIFQLTGVIQ